MDEFYNGILTIGGADSSDEDSLEQYDYDSLPEKVTPEEAPDVEVDEGVDEEVDAAVGTGVEDEVVLPREQSETVLVAAPNERISSNFMTTYEITDAVSIRATQIAQSGVSTVKIGELDNPVDIAKKEMMERMCPLIIRRQIGHKKDKSGIMRPYFEFWSPNEMGFPVFYGQK